MLTIAPLLIKIFKVQSLPLPAFDCQSPSLCLARARSRVSPASRELPYRMEQCALEIDRVAGDGHCPVHKHESSAFCFRVGYEFINQNQARMDFNSVSHNA